MITITAFKWLSPFAQGQVRDHRLRRVLNEVGRPYKVRLLDAQDQQSARYRSQQPFGQVPSWKRMAARPYLKPAQSSSTSRTVPVSCCARLRHVEHARAARG